MGKIYYSSTPSIPTKYNDVIGIIENAMYGIREKNMDKFNFWILDSGGFTKEFDLGKWKEELNVALNYKEKLQFIVIPDKVFDYKTTLDMFYKYVEIPKNLGLKVAFVTQDNIPVKDIPYKFIDAIFIGGSNEHKLGKEGENIIELSNILAIPVHVGRVNSISRLRQFWNCQSWDGTHFNYDPKEAEKFAITVRGFNDCEKEFYIYGKDE
jgi:hypothetical protein